MEKDLKDISWLVDEPTYRADPALSYSTLARYEREGYNNLEHLFDQISTPSLIQGSALDAIITGGLDEFTNNFIVLDINLTESGINIAKQLVAMNLPYKEFEDIPEIIVSQAAKEVEFWKADKWDKVRYREVLKTGNISDYYNALIHSNKTILDTSTYEKVLAMARSLRMSPATHYYFEDNDEISPVKRYYQLKFKATFNNVDYRCMADEIIVNYEDKKIYPIDLKSSGHREWDFESSFIKWSYAIQARTYWAIIRDNLDRDTYFKDFTLENYRFIVINKDSLTPLVWEFPLTKERGTLVDDLGKEYRDPFEIGVELRGYLDCKPPVPNGINENGLNIINCLHMKK